MPNLRDLKPDRRRRRRRTRSRWAWFIRVDHAVSRSARSGSPIYGPRRSSRSTSRTVPDRRPSAGRCRSTSAISISHAESDDVSSDQVSATGRDAPIVDDVVEHTRRRRACRFAARVAGSTWSGLITATGPPYAKSAADVRLRIRQSHARQRRAVRTHPAFAQLAAAESVGRLQSALSVPLPRRRDVSGNDAATECGGGDQDRDGHRLCRPRHIEHAETDRRLRDRGVALHPRRDGHGDNIRELRSTRTNRGVVLPIPPAMPAASRARSRSDPFKGDGTASSTKDSPLTAVNAMTIDPSADMDARR
jgi:hypothetical protein